MTSADASARKIRFTKAPFEKLRNYIGQGPPMTPDLQPTLCGTLVELRPLHPGDFDALFAVASDPGIWEQHPVRDRYKEDVFKDFFREALDSRGAFAVIDRQTRQLIGSSRYYGYDEARREVEIGWTFLARAYWGGAYNRDMKNLLLRHAFQFAERVIFLVGPQNFRSQRAMEKIGGVRAGMTRREPEGRESVVFEITRATFSD